VILTSHSLAYWIAIAFDFSPALPLAVAWLRIGRAGEPLKAWTLAPLLAATFSLGWLALGLFVPMALGPTYSGIRFGIIDTNFAIMLVAAIAAFRKTSRASLPTSIGCTLMALVWSFVGTINSVV
jgi:hypothetical protein